MRKYWQLRFCLLFFGLLRANKQADKQTHNKQTHVRPAKLLVDFYVWFSNKKKCLEFHRQLTRPLQSCAFSSASLIPFRRICSNVCRNVSSSWLRDARNNVVTNGNLSIFILIDFFVAQIEWLFSHSRSHSLFPLLALEKSQWNWRETELIKTKQFINRKLASCLLAMHISSRRCSNFEPFLIAHGDCKRNWKVIWKLNGKKRNKSKHLIKPIIIHWSYNNEHWIY